MSILINKTKHDLIIYELKYSINISRIVDKAKRKALRLRLHFKTHQNEQIAEWYRKQVYIVLLFLP
jgi:D-serine deaminase-like pyridoxal phosphate-dependent protein